MLTVRKNASEDEWIGVLGRTVYGLRTAAEGVSDTESDPFSVVCYIC